MCTEVRPPHLIVVEYRFTIEKKIKYKNKFSHEIYKPNLIWQTIYQFKIQTKYGHDSVGAVEKRELNNERTNIQYNFKKHMKNATKKWQPNR